MKKSVVLIFVSLFLSGFVVSQTRVVLIEQFTNSGCPPCAAATPTTLGFVDNNSIDVVAIAYHTSFPYKDSMHLENVPENKYRTAFYGVVSVPYTVMDGNVFNGTSSTFNQNISTHINSRKATAPRYDVVGSALTLVGNKLKGTFSLSSLNNSNNGELLVAHMVVIEKNVQKNAYSGSPGENSETEYGYVMRKMLPDTSGISLANNGVNGTDVISLDWTTSKIKDVNQVHVVVFVQNRMTKEIYQAAMFKPAVTVGISEQQSNNANSIQVFPNPSTNNFLVHFESEQYVKSITITNQTGEQVYEQTLNGTVHQARVATDLQNGIYFLTVSGSSGIVTKKITVLK